MVFLLRHAGGGGGVGCAAGVGGGAGAAAEGGAGQGRGGEGLGGRYRALVDGGERQVVRGRAFEVLGVEEEQALRAYETGRYEVVRCRIEIGAEVVWGCTFWFRGLGGSWGEDARASCFGGWVVG